MKMTPEMERFFFRYLATGIRAGQRFIPDVKPIVAGAAPGTVTKIPQEALHALRACGKSAIVRAFDAHACLTGFPIDSSTTLDETTGLWLPSDSGFYEPLDVTGVRDIWIGCPPTESTSTRVVILFSSQSQIGPER